MRGLGSIGGITSLAFLSQSGNSNPPKSKSSKSSNNSYKNSSNYKSVNCSNYEYVNWNEEMSPYIESYKNNFLVNKNLNKDFHNSDIVYVPVYNENEILVEEKWLRNNILHRDNSSLDLPAYISYDHGYKKEEIWYNNGIIHRNSADGDLPAVIMYYPEKGYKKCKKWYKNGKLHRESDLPAEIWYDKNGNKELEQWFYNDKLFRSSGLPTQIWYSETNRKDNSWFINGLNNPSI